MRTSTIRLCWSLRRWFCVGALCIVGAASAQGVTGTVEPASPVVRFVDRDASAILHLFNPGSEGLKARLEALPFVLKGGAGLASVRFVGADGKTTLTEIEVPPAVGGRPGALDVRIDVTGMQAPGAYEGSIEIVPAASGVLRRKVPLSVTRQSSTFDPILRGAGIVNGVLTFKPQSRDDRVTWFTVENAKGAADIDVLVTAPAGLSGKGIPVKITIAPAQKARVAPGSVLPVSVTLEKVESASMLSGKLLVSDAGESGARKELDFLVQPTFTSRCTVAWIVGLVIAGTLLSVLVGTVVPTLLSRQKAWRRLRAMVGSIEAATEGGSVAQLALKAQLHRIDFLAHAVWWFSTRATDTFVEIATQADLLESRIKLVSQAQELRAQARSSDTVPVSVVPGIGRRLDAAVKSAVVGAPADAQKGLDEVQAQLKDAALLANVQASLQTRISALPAAPAGANTAMVARLAALQTQLPALGATTVGADTLLRLDRECFSAHIYFVRYLSDVMGSRGADDDFVAMDALILDDLNRGVSGMWRANDLVQSLELGVLPKHMDDACANHKGGIVAKPTETRFNELVELNFVFDDPILNESPLMKRFAIQWTFDDATSSVAGPRCLHFFKAGADTRWGRNDAERNIVALANGSEFKLKLRVRGIQSGDAIVARAEVLSTVVVLEGAVALALITHQSDIKSLESLSDFINPFLWGFGLDQMKNLVSKR
jgi:hypothetical protein